jgi:tetratricopeptide (TPR) repeat protein
MKIIRVIVAFLFIILFIGCEKPQKKSAGELYEEAQVFLTDINKGDPAKALEILNKAIALEPGFLEAYLSRAEAHMSLGENDKAFQDFNTALQIDPNEPNIYLKRGEIYSDLKQYEKAFEDYNQAIRLKPNYANVYFERGRIYFAIGVYNKAYEDFTKALTIDPSHTRANLYIDEVRPLVSEVISYDKTISKSGGAATAQKIKAASKPSTGSPSSQANQQYIDNNDGTVIDRYTGNMWQKENDDTARTWEGARQYCEGLTLAGYNDWVLPTSNVLRELNVTKDRVHAVDKIFKCKRWGYWSNSTSPKDPNKASAIMYDYLAEYDGYVGIVTHNNKSAWRYVRCVRMK